MLLDSATLTLLYMGRSRATPMPTPVSALLCSLIACSGVQTGTPRAAAPGAVVPARRTVLQRALGVAGGAAAAALGAAAPAEASLAGADWPLWPALPLAPYGKRKTVRREAVPGKVWTFDQMLGVFYVHVPIRMTVVAMEQGGLFVYAPVAPTRECLELLQPIIDAHGPVKHMVLPSVAPEHKVLAGPFAKNFPGAEFWVTDKQYAFPLNLPPTWLGLPGEIKVLPASSEGAGMWGGEFEHAILTAKAGRPVTSALHPVRGQRPVCLPGPSEGSGLAYAPRSAAWAAWELAVAAGARLRPPR